MNSKIDIIEEAILDVENDSIIDEKKNYLHQRKINRKKRKCPPSSVFDYPIYKELKDIIICNDLTKISPRRWDELEIDFEDKNKRFCKITNKPVIKVTNEVNYNAIKNNNICMAIPYKGVLQDKLNKNLQQYIKLYYFIQISRRLIMGCGYDEESDISGSDLYGTLDYIFSYITDDFRDFNY